MSARADLFTALRSRVPPLLIDDDRSWTASELLAHSTESTVLQLSNAVVGLRLAGDTASQLSALLQCWQKEFAVVLLPPHWSAPQTSGICAQLRSATPPKVDDAATVVFTSGSTGRPSGLLHTFAQQVLAAETSQAVLPLGEGDRWLLSLPLVHVGGLQIVFRCATAGATVVAGEGSLVANVVRHRPTHLSVVDKQLRVLLDDEMAVRVLQEAKGILVGGGPLTDATAQRALALGLPLRATYGSTESCAQVVTASASSPLQLTERLPEREVRITDDGAIAIRSPTLACSRFSDGAWGPFVDDDGWYVTRDAGAFVDDVLVVSGRLDRMFISGGENVQPEAIEQALCAVDGIARAVVVPVDDGDYGQRPYAFVQGAPVDIDALNAQAKLVRHEKLVGVDILAGDASLKPQLVDLQCRAQSLYDDQVASRRRS